LFPAGVYSFEITITIGDIEHVVTFTLTIMSECDVPVLTLTVQPEAHIFYHVGDPAMLVFEYNLMTIVHSSVTVNCGEPSMIFYDSFGFALDITIFDYSCTGYVCGLTVFTTEINVSIDISIQFMFFYSGMPGVYVTSNVFIITIVNPCLPPPDCIFIIGCGIPPTTVNPPVIDIQIEVTVSVDVVIDLPPWNCGTPGCDTQVIIDCTINCDMGGSGVVVIINNEINIHIDSCDCNGCCGDTPDGNVIIVVVTGCLDINICVDVDVPVTIYNPCLDINIFQLVPITIPDHECTIFGDPCEMPHQAFEIIAESEIIIEICLVIYTADGGDIDIFIEYNVDLHIVIFYCEDMDLVDQTFTITITVYVEGLIN
jgi:hypothetical protein